MASKHFLVSLVAVSVLCLATSTEAFGPGYVSRGSHLKGTTFRHGDIALAVPLLATANRRLVKQIYFGNWLRDFSQLLDRSSLSLVPRPILRALVAVFAFVQFGYATREFEVTDEKLGFYRPEEHVDNPKGYDNGSGPSLVDERSQNGLRDEKALNYRTSEGLRPKVHSVELAFDPRSGMKNYIANQAEVGSINNTSAAYVEQQLLAAVACGRQGNEEAYLHLGAALHTLEDFAAHSNFVELTMQLIGSEVQDQAKVTPALRKVFAFVGDGAKVRTARGEAPPLVTGTFGALDLYQTLLGEIDDKLSALSLPGLEERTSGDGGALQMVAKSLIGLLGPLTPNFEQSIVKIQRSAANPKPANWGELETKPEKLWESLEPILKLRDDIVKWVYDHLAIKAVQDALAAISTAIDKMVYLVMGIFLRPILPDLTKMLKDQEQRLLHEDQAIRLAKGEESIFAAGSRTTDPTHSQLAKDHYDHPLNEIAGRVAVRVSSYTITQIVQLWQPGIAEDPRPAIQSVLEAFHHPFNSSPNSAVQSLMHDEVRSYIRDSLLTKTVAFESQLQSLSASSMASRMDVHSGLPGGHTHVDAHSVTQSPDYVASSAVGDPTAIGKTDAQHNALLDRLNANIGAQVREGKIKGVGEDDLPKIRKLFSASPSGETPNPLDFGLTKLPGASFLGTFDDIGISELAAAEGMGETLKDAVITLMLLDDKRGMKEEDIASQRFGWGRSEADKQEKLRLKELRVLLDFKNSEAQQGEAELDAKMSAGERLKVGMEKLKLKGGK